MKVHDAMEISFTLTEREETTAEGEKVVAFFQKTERFKNFLPFTPILLWDQTQLYGYNRREDGKCEVFHRGEKFYGPFPIRLLVQLHARYVIWATEKHINSPVFGSGDLEEQEHQRSNVPLHVVQDFFHRLSIAQQIAIETGKIAAGKSTEEAEATLKKLKKLQQTPTQIYVNTLKRANDNGGKLKRTTSSIEVADPATQQAIDSALASLTTGNSPAAATARDAVASLVAHQPHIVEQPAKYGGAFRPKALQ